jgi:type II secretory pathway component PulK
MSKRLQIPINTTDEELFKSAAKQEGLSTAEWARRLLIQKAKATLEGFHTREEALKKLFSISAPVDTVEVMKKESIKNRYK